MAYSLIRENALKNPNYAPYCGPCPGLVRMKKIEPLFWRCERCGAIHDERDQSASTSTTTRVK